MQMLADIVGYVVFGKAESFEHGVHQLQRLTIVGVGVGALG